MAGSAIRSVFSTNQLETAWSYVNTRTKNKLSSGTDRQTLQAFKQDLDKNLRALQHELFSPEGYRFSTLLPVLVPKPNGKQRLICVPTVRDRVVQRCIVEHLSDGDKCGVLNSVSYGFVRDRTVEKAISRVKNLRTKFQWAYKADISSFFDSLERRVLDGLIRKTVKSQAIRQLLSQACRCEIAGTYASGEKAIEKMGIKRGYGVRQGMPLSPLFANLMLKNFDRSVEDAKLKMVRYADDLIFLAGSEAECRSIAKFCDGKLALLNLSLDGDKSATYAPNDAAEFLGVGVVRRDHSYSVRVLDPQLKKIQERISARADFNRLTREGVTLARFVQSLDGMISGYVGAYEFCDNFDDVERKLAMFKEQAVRSILRQALNIDPATLNAAQMAFLGAGLAGSRDTSRAIQPARLGEADMAAQVAV